MKANQRAIYNDEEAVSPVIAVILMVAITVVLAATVFVLVNELGANVGSTGPNLGLSTVAGSTTGDTWTLRLNSATTALPITEYTFILTPPGGAPCSAAMADPDVAEAFAGGAAACVDATVAHTDIADDDALATGDRLVIDATGTVATDFGAGQWTLELLHRPTGATAATLARSF